MTLLERICASVDSACIVRRLRKEGCTVGLDGTHDHRLILDLDRPASPLGPDEARCDYLLFIQPPEAQMCVVPLELKGGSARTHVVDQLQAGAKLANRLLPASAPAVLRPVLAYRSMPTEVSKELRRRPIQFRNTQNYVGRMKCGTALANAIRP